MLLKIVAAFQNIRFIIHQSDAKLPNIFPVIFFAYAVATYSDFVLCNNDMWCNIYTVENGTSYATWSAGPLY